MIRPNSPFRLTLTVMLLSLFIGTTGANADGSPYIGMQPQELPKKANVAMGLPEETKLIAIRDVGRDTPAERAGVQRGDVLLTFNGENVGTLAEVIAIITELSPGDTIDLTVLRQGKEIELSMATIEWPAPRQIKKNYIGQIPALGLTTGALTQKIRTQFGIRWDSEGVVVTLVDPTKGISEIIKRGDVIVQFNQQPIWLPEQLIDAYAVAKGAGMTSSLLLLERPDGYVFIMLPVR